MDRPRWDDLRWDEEPELRAPALVVAFTGWNDAADAASLAVRSLIEGWGARRIASIDPEEYFEFQATRPQVRLVDGVTREIVWPGNELWAASAPHGDVLLLLGTEPQLKWRTFCGLITGVAQRYRSPFVVTLGALLADVPHRRPVSIIGTASDQATIDRHGLQRSRYEGPTGIVGVLHDACTRDGLLSASLWAATPAYAPGTTSPKAALALVRRCLGMLGASLDLRALEDAARRYEAEVDAQVADDDDLSGYVRRLETMASDDEDADEVPPVAADERSAEQLLEELEQFLRDQDGGR
jgi:proteasome assembly chaperone (PAC2) family protein